MLLNFIIYIASFIGIWIGAGLAIKSVESISRSLKISSFVLSFFILGFFTSMSELSVGANAIIVNDPEIYVGNLIGASLVIFLLIIPILAIASNGLRINQGFQGFNLFISMIVIGAPVMLSMDGKVDRFDSIISIILYFLLVVCIHTKRNIIDSVRHLKKAQSIRLIQELGKIALGIVIIFIASKFVVDQTLYFSRLLQVSPFLISLLIIAVGTNIPELSLTVRSIFMKNNQIAFGDYVGSAAFNTFLFGLLTIVYGKTVYLSNSYFISLLFLTSGLVIFYFFAKKEHIITRWEGILLFFIYAAFLVVEVMLHGKRFIPIPMLP